MSLSLRDQLLAAGLVSKKQVQQADQQKRQQLKSKQPAPAEAQRRAAEKAAADKAARDADLNRKQQDKAERKARLAQVKQLVEQNRLPKVTEGDDWYNFIDGKKVRRIAVDTALRTRLIRGELMIARCEGRYELVPAAIAERIGERDQHSVIRPVVGEDKPADENDPYKDFVVPDDLRW